MKIITKALLPACIAAALLVATPARAIGEQGVSVYHAAFFTDAHPSTAADMVERVPGFTLDTGQSARGFAGTAGNVLIDGARPTAKTDDLSTILGRIPAASVARIELIRGGAPGIDMQGLSVVANIVRLKGDSRSIILGLNNTFIGNGDMAPGGLVEYHGESDGLRYEAALARTAQNWDDAPGGGYRLLQVPGGAAQYDDYERRGIMRLGWQAHGGLIAPLWGGEWNNNATLQSSNYSSSVLYAGYGGSRFDSINHKRQGEFGSHWQGDLGGLNLETLVLQRLSREASSNTSLQSSGAAAFLGVNNSGESISRFTLRYTPWTNVETRFGGEAAYNFLDGRSSYVSNGAPIALPNANIAVNEKRGEVFGQATWKITPAWTLEGGARMEFSTISESGGTAPARSFFYPKPRLLLSFAPDNDNQARFRIERTVGQLNFSDFVASSNLAGYGVAAGNSNLRPDQRWQFELTAEKHFWDRGAIVISMLHEEITDLQDYIPVGGGLDAPGNIPQATSDKLTVTGTLPLDWLGLEKGLLKPNLIWWTSNLADPVTGQMRRISNQRDTNIYFTFTQDLDAWNSSWELGFGPTSFNRTTWRIAQISRVKIHNPYLWASWTYKPSTDWSITANLDNMVPYRFELQQLNYPGPRNLGGLPTLQDGFTRTEPRLTLQLRKTI